MKSNRSKITPIETPQTREAAEALVREISALTASRNGQLAELDQAIAKLREGYEATITQANELIETKTHAVMAWADANPAAFAGLKSLEFLSGVIGWRTGKHTLKTLPGWTWDRVLEKLCGNAGWRAQYVRVQEEVNKQSLLDNRDTIGAETLAKMGVKVVQAESFFVDPKIESPENRSTLAA